MGLNIVVGILAEAEAEYADGGGIVPLRPVTLRVS
jgi:hypothetical protein